MNKKHTPPTKFLRFFSRFGIPQRREVEAMNQVVKQFRL